MKTTFLVVALIAAAFMVGCDTGDDKTGDDKTGDDKTETLFAAMPEGLVGSWTGLDADPDGTGEVASTLEITADSVTINRNAWNTTDGAAVTGELIISEDNWVSDAYDDTTKAWTVTYGDADTEIIFVMGTTAQDPPLTVVFPIIEDIAGGPIAFSKDAAQ